MPGLEAGSSVQMSTGPAPSYPGKSDVAVEIDPGRQREKNVSLIATAYIHTFALPRSTGAERKAGALWGFGRNAF